MPFTVDVTDAPCGALIRGLDLRSLDDDLAERIRDVWLDHHVLGFPDQDLNLEEFEQVALRFGPFGVDPYFKGLDENPHVAEIRREPDETSPLFAEGWHSDWSFLATPPAMTLLLGRIIPPVGGDTLYADQHLAYQALPDTTKQQIEGLVGIHSARRGYAKQGLYGDKDVGRSMSIVASDSALATQAHPIVRAHPETGEPALFVSPAYTIGIEGMADEEAQAILRDLFAWQGRDEFVYRHRWSAGMLTMWDNRSVVHAATGGYQGHRRLLHRITVSERPSDR